MAHKCCYNKILMNFFGEEKMKTRQDKTMVKIYLFTIIIEFFLGHILKINKKLVHGHSSWSTFILDLMRGPKIL